MALVHFLGTDAPGITVEKLVNPRTLLVLGVAPVRIDVLTSILGVESFTAAWRRRVEGVFGAVPAHYLSLDDLILAKDATPATRLQDKADLAALLKVVRKSRSPRRPVAEKPSRHPPQSHAGRPDSAAPRRTTCKIRPKNA
jgi:hypothetical protein